ncbi:hypothetical protein [Blastococcus saxobsidens]|uniref:Uncharacterized protein n=1 Tax=Blastococcus saxobsidens (strain DD2) TaxID=1146883 RepID=H6RR56_BLASD|nr:hypothetical protein [Blastococcus saxobsidens]CCG04136.1 conserved protein of unknown function [Blastococcus saxobsidens DD2]
MRVWLLVYGVLYVVIELTGSALQRIGWPQLTALDVAAALVDAFLTVSVALAVLLAAQLGARRWSAPLFAGRPAAAVAPADPERPIGVRSWRPAPPALPAAAPAPAPGRSTYSVGAYGSGTGRRGRRLAPSFPEEPGHLL